MVTTEIEKAAIAHQKLRLQGEKDPNHPDDFANLTWDYYKGHPRITVWSRHHEEATLTGLHNGVETPFAEIPIEVRSTYPRLKSMVMSMIENLKHDEPWTKHFVTYQPVKNDAGGIVRGERKQCTVVHYGRDSQGRNFIRVKGEGRLPTKHNMVEDEYHSSKDEYNNMTEESNFIARGYLDSIKAMLDSGFERTYDADFKPWKKDK